MGLKATQSLVERAKRSYRSNTIVADDGTGFGVSAVLVEVIVSREVPVRQVDSLEAVLSSRDPSLKRDHKSRFGYSGPSYVFTGHRSPECICTAITTGRKGARLCLKFMTQVALA